MMTPEERARYLSRFLQNFNRPWEEREKYIAAAIREAQREQMELDVEIVLDIKLKAWTTAGILIETSEAIRREFEKKPE